MTYHKTDDSGSSDCHSRRRRRGHPFRSRRSSEGARKERVLHTRVSEQLSDDIRRFAEDLRVPASNLVRNVLEEVFMMVDSVSDDVGDLLDDVLEEAEGVRDRVRNQSRRSHQRTRRGRRRSVSETDIEDELRADEATEAGRSTAGGKGSGDADLRAATDSTHPDAEGESSSPARAPASELFPDVLGWQPLVLNRDFECGRCARRLGAGESAFLGLAAGGLTDTALCGRCAGHR